MNSVLTPVAVPCLARSFVPPFCLQPSLVSGRAFRLSHFFFLARSGGFGQRGLDRRRSPVRERGPRLKASRVARTLAQHDEPNRVYDAIPSGTAALRTGVSHSDCSPRLHCCTAVAFGYRPVNVGLAGTSTPLNERLYRRTSAGFIPQDRAHRPHALASSKTHPKANLPAD